MLSLGPAGAQFAFHQHMAAWLKVEEGSKVVLTAPHDKTPALRLLARPPVDSLPELLDESAAADGPSVCVMRPGDVLWLPPMSWHATLNLADTLAIGGQADPASLAEEDWAAVGGMMEREGEYCGAEGERGLASAPPLTAIRTLSWCKQCIAAGRVGRGVAAAEAYLTQLLGAADAGNASREDAQIAVLLMEDCVDSVPGAASDDATRLRRWGWQEAWQRWPGFDPLQLRKTLTTAHKPERELRRLAAKSDDDPADPIRISVDLSATIRGNLSRAQNTVLVVTNPLLERTFTTPAGDTIRNPIHANVMASLRALNPSSSRYLAWFVYPQLAVAEPEPGRWDLRGSRFMQMLEDYMAQTFARNRTVLLNLATQPCWLFGGPNRNAANCSSARNPDQTNFQWQSVSCHDIAGIWVAFVPRVPAISLPTGGSKAR